MVQVVRDLAARLRLEVDRASFAAGNARINNITNDLKAQAGFRAAQERAQLKLSREVAAAERKIARDAARENALGVRNAARLERTTRLDELERRRLAFKQTQLNEKWQERRAKETSRAHALDLRQRASAQKAASAQQERSADVIKSASMTALGAVGVAAAAAAAEVAFISKHFIEFNSNIEQSTISLAAQERLMGKAGSWQQAMGTATGLFSHYQEVAKASVGTTADFLEMHKQVAASAYGAGLNLDQVKQLTKGGVIAGSTLGFRSDETGREIQQMIAGSISTRDRLSQLLLKSQNVSADKFRAMSKKQRAEMTLKAFTAPAFQESAKQMEGSFAGVSSTLEDTLQISMGKIGKPIFAGLVAGIKRFNAWLDGYLTPAKVQMLADGFKLWGGYLEKVLVVVKAMTAPARFIMDFAEDLYVWAKGGQSLMGDAFMYLSEKFQKMSFEAREYLKNIVPIDKWLADLDRFYQKLPGPVRAALSFEGKAIQTAFSPVKAATGKTLTEQIGPLSSLNRRFYGSGGLAGLLWNKAFGTPAAAAPEPLASYQPGVEPGAGGNRQVTVTQNVTISEATDAGQVRQVIEEANQSMWQEVQASF